MITNHLGSQAVEGGLPPVPVEISGRESSDLGFKKGPRSCCVGDGLEASLEGSLVGRLALGRVQSDGGLEESGAVVQRRGQMREGYIQALVENEHPYPFSCKKGCFLFPLFLFFPALPFLIAVSEEGLVPSSYARDRQVAIFPSPPMRGDPVFFNAPSPCKGIKPGGRRTGSCGWGSNYNSPTPK